jgi:hypothetical protein
MDTDKTLSNELKGSKPQYVALARQSPDSEYMVTVGSGWKVKGDDNIVLRLDLLSAKWTALFSWRAAKIINFWPKTYHQRATEDREIRQLGMQLHTVLHNIR